MPCPMADMRWGLVLKDERDSKRSSCVRDDRLDASDVVHPAAPRAAIIEHRLWSRYGVANDASFARYVLDFSRTGQHMAVDFRSSRSVDPAALLGDWVLGTSFGSFTLRFQCFRVGKHNALLVPLNRPQPVDCCWALPCSEI